MNQGTFRITGMDLSGYMVEDAPRAIAFYRDVLGLEPVVDLSRQPGRGIRAS